MIALDTGALTEIAVLGAHCDDIAIGMGGALLAAVAANPGLRVHALVLSGGGSPREAEERDALADFCAGGSVRLTVLDIPDGRAPGHWERIKDALAEFRRGLRTDLVFGPHRCDAHQDHRLLAELVPTEFRDHLVLGYEIPKWEAESWRPSVYLPLTAEHAEHKSRLLHKHYRSQTGRDWFDERTFLSVARLRGVQCRAPYAEAFSSDKAVLQLGNR
ncbi:PIG-L family deacetylase [Nocardia puris]|uniref:LmbE family N-acetylglucosaminyl deacetylase n=1 Tax=Nocardia puris TaxID=208602 RepID=A0A366DWC3_9NOCA|nr:PIG-L family deacetylase [Nocardia puris]MBF6209874.1 PIG-L family deacetylase [Nocardia puris]MBF6366446.1 PIG-L family deacetylase [Nocardia puris]MBF6458215.1 PIG-L family deacetylase [Nocardia puris]RBO94387.1 LmbE family N-acetylglucosaminyl deacetylase [Nocardia puris]